MKLLAIGDIFGNQGRKMVKEYLPVLKKEHNIDMVIANGENSAGGIGITYNVAQELYACGIDVITLGNHVWAKKEILNFINEDQRIVRPANYPSFLPGSGSTIFKTDKFSVGVININGRVSMDPIDCPFNAVMREIEDIKNHVDIIVVDFHAEATSEKVAMGWYLDGKATIVFGTHTHVQTADERILPHGTAYITDLGMTGPHNSVIGVDKDIIIKKYTTLIPEKYETAKGDLQLNGCIFEIDEHTKKVIEIRRIFEVKS